MCSKLIFWPNGIVSCWGFNLNEALPCVLAVVYLATRLVGYFLYVPRRWLDNLWRARQESFVYEEVYHYRWVFKRTRNQADLSG